MRFLRHYFFIVAVVWVPAFASEPTGGVIKDLVFFSEPPISDSIRYHAYTMTGPHLDYAVFRNGTASIRFDPVSYYPGVQVIWSGSPDPNDYWGPDSSVWWVQPSSRFQMWYRSEVSGNVVAVSIMEKGSLHGELYRFTVPVANTWHLIDIPIPEGFRGYPMKGLEIGIGYTLGKFHIDDLMVTNVRMYAGRGTPRPPAMDYIAASQVGYGPNMKKQFTSPVDFNNYDIVRVSDNAVVYTGGGSIRAVLNPGVLGNSPVFIGDFTGFRTPGRYKIVANGYESLPFTIGGDVFDGPLRDAFRFFYYQRAFTPVEMPYAEGPWVHPSDANLAPPGTRKGWHDAGDLTIYMPTMTQTIWWLLESYMDFPVLASRDDLNLPESGNGTPDVLDEARWGLEWVLSVQTPEGGFHHMSAAHGGNHYGTPYGTTTPNNVNPYINCGGQTVQQAAKAVAVLAYASKVFRPFAPGFADTCLLAARRGWAWMLANPNAIEDQLCGGQGYPQGTDPDLLKSNKMWAAAAMLYATGEQQYESAFQTNYTIPNWISSYSKSDAFAGKMYLRITAGADAFKQQQIRSAFAYHATTIRTEANEHPFQFATHYYWGCNSNAAHRVSQFSWPAYVEDTTRIGDRDALLDNVHYIFGRNYLNLGYVSGLDRWGATQWRKEGFHHWMKALQATPHHFPGALAGGPNQSPSAGDGWYWNDPRYPRNGNTPVDGRFTDNDSWSTNEITINWNGAYLYLMLAAKTIIDGPSHAGTLPAGSLSVFPDSLPPSGGTVTLQWLSYDAVSASIDQGIGPVSLHGSMDLSVSTTTTYTLTLTNSYGQQTFQKSVQVGLPGGGEGPQDITALGTPIAMVMTPTGGGNHNIEVIRDGVTPPPGSANAQDQYDTFNNQSNRQFEWIGYEYPTARTFARMVFQEGMHFSNGGWFEILGVQVKVDGVWEDVQNLVCTPAYAGNNGVNFETFELSFDPATGDGIRLAGKPGGVSTFVSVAELRVVSHGSSTVPPVRTIPKDYGLDQNFPNPFNPSTRITYKVPVDQDVRVVVYDLLGREVAVLAEGFQSAGTYTADFSAEHLSNGVYFYSMVAGEYVELRKMILLK
jgi:endoglucanase